MASSARFAASYRGGPRERERMDENTFAAIRWRTLIAALPETSTIAMVGAPPVARTPWGPGAERCVCVGTGWRTELPDGAVTVVLESREPEAMALASTIAVERGGGELWALLPSARDAAPGVIPAARKGQPRRSVATPPRPVYRRHGRHFPP